LIFKFHEIKSFVKNSKPNEKIIVTTPANKQSENKNCLFLSGNP